MNSSKYKITDSRFNTHMLNNLKTEFNKKIFDIKHNRWTFLKYLSIKLGQRDIILKKGKIIKETWNNAAFLIIFDNFLVV